MELVKTDVAYWDPLHTHTHTHTHTHKITKPIKQTEINTSRTQLR